MTNFSPITFVCCVESGSLEFQTIRMIESLRRWGGQFANAPIIAVTPRFGSPLSRQTNQVFKRLNVQYIRYSAKTDYSWFKFLNKPLALVAAEKYIQSESICWLDSDLLFVDEPDQLILKEGEDFAACASDKEQGTFGPEDPFDKLWEDYCQTIGININDLPWITTEREAYRIRLYWNSGIFSYRRSTNFSQHFLQTTLQLLEARSYLKISGYSVSSKEMSAVVLAMVKQGLVWRALPYSHNYSLSSLDYDMYKEEQLKVTKIIHYHDAMWPHFFPTFIECLKNTHPTVAEWVSSLGPIKNISPIQWRIANKVIQYFRQKQQVDYEKSCRVI